MKLSKALLLGIAALSLASCSSGDNLEISHEDFIYFASKCEETNYSKAFFTYSYLKRQSSNTGESFPDEKEDNQLFFHNNNGVYELDDDQHLTYWEENMLGDFFGSIGYHIKNSTSNGGEQDNDGRKNTFYKSPLAVESVFPTERSEQGGIKYEYDRTCYAAYNYHGYISKMVDHQTTVTKRETENTIRKYIVETRFVIKISYR